MVLLLSMLLLVLVLVLLELDLFIVIYYLFRCFVVFFCKQKTQKFSKIPKITKKLLYPCTKTILNSETNEKKTKNLQKNKNKNKKKLCKSNEIYSHKTYHQYNIINDIFYIHILNTNKQSAKNVKKLVTKFLAIQQKI